MSSENTMQARYSDYDDWATLYNQTVAEDYGDPQWQWLKRELVPLLSAGNSVLDLCCGSGQLIRPLLQSGFSVTGLDGSEAMLNCARDNAPDAHYVLDDARYFSLPDQFHAVVSTSASLNHIDSISEMRQVFQCVNQSLKPGGYFLFDLNHPRQMERWWQGRPTEGQIGAGYAWMITPRYDAGRTKGAFTVTQYRQHGTASNGLVRRSKNALYRQLDKPRFIGLRLALIKRLKWLEPSWAYQNNDYPVTGHDLQQIRQSLFDTGFNSVVMQTIDGQQTIDANHSAHFICRKDSQ